MMNLLCIGNAMVDVFAEVPEDFCKRFGLDSPVQHVGSELTSAILSALPEDKIISSGGGAANTAKIASRLGLSVAFTGAAGSDTFADFFKEELELEGVSLHLVRKKSPTGLFISLASKSPQEISEKHSITIAASPSAALELDAEDLDEEMFANQSSMPMKPGAGSICVIEGFLLNRERLLGRILELVNKYHLTLALDPGTSEIAQEQAQLILQNHSPFWDSKNRCSLFPLILFFNEAEAENFAKTLLSDWENLFISVSRDTSVLPIVKLAERGAAVFSGGKVYYAKAEKVNAVESTGAGDAFAAGFLTAWLQGKSPEQCGQAGNTAAALVLKAPGTILPG